MPRKPFTSAIRALAPLAGVAMTNGRIGAAVVTETNNGVASRITYNQFRIDRWAGGKIAGVTAGPLTTESPYPDTLLTMQAGSVEAHDIDLDAALRVLDPDRYAGGLGDGVWHQVTRLAAYHDVSAGIPGVKLTLRLVSAENVRLRQPPHSFADTLDAAMAAPSPAAGDVAPASASTDMLSAYALGRFGISGLDVTASGLAGIHLGGFSATDLAVDHIGDLAINDFAASVEDQGAIRIGGLALGDIVLPDLGAAASAMLGSGAGVDSNPLDLVPRIGSVNASAIDIAATGLPRTKLAKLRLDLGGHVGPVPTSIAADVQGLVFPVALLPGGAQAALHQLGYDQLDLACQAKANWNASDETLTVDELNVTLKDAGALNLSAELRGLPRQAIADPLALADAVPGLSLNKAAVTLEDDSIVGKGIDMVAARMHAPPAAFRQKFADVMPLVLSLYTLGNPKIAALVNQTGVLARLAPAVKALVASPGSSLTVTLAPPTPVTFPAIASTAQDAPKTLIDMLGFSVASSAAAKAGGPAAPASPPAR